MSDPQARDDDKLAAEVRVALPRPPRVPQEVDAAILASARRALVEPRVRPVRPFLRRVVVAAAAAVLVSGLSFWFRGTDPRDLDRSGQIDIVDAYLLAVRVEVGDVRVAESTDLDLTGDGQIDDHDVNAIAHFSVRLGSRR